MNILVSNTTLVMSKYLSEGTKQNLNTEAINKMLPIILEEECVKSYGEFNQNEWNWA